MIAMNKRDLRSMLRRCYAGEEVRAAESRQICQHILASPLYERTRIVGGYMPMTREADIIPVLTAALRQGKTLALPLCDAPPHMTLRKVASLAELHEGTYGILEPDADAPIIPVEEIDLLLVPLEGIDHNGWRLGKGGGYYDHLLMDADVVTLGCALSWQWAEEIPHDVWDRKLHACADQNGIHMF